MLEFFAEDKSEYQTFLYDNALLNKVSEVIRGYLPIDIAYIRERIGNLIFQFPITLVAVGESTNAEGNTILFNVAWHPKLKELPACGVVVQSELDGLLLSFAQQSNFTELNSSVQVGSTDAQVESFIYDKSTSLDTSYFSRCSYKGL